MDPSNVKMLLFAGLITGICFTQAGAEINGGEEKRDQTNKTLQPMIFQPKHFVLIDADGFMILKYAPLVGTVYFFRNYDRNSENNIFLSWYDQAASFLKTYGLELGVVDCSRWHLEPLPTLCRKEDDMVHTYRRGEKIMGLDMETMFDLNSITSNILQLALMDDVSIVLTKENRRQLESKNAGNKDVIYSYHDAVGTYEHRVFMEIAFAYQDKYKFVVTTEKSSTADLQDSTLIRNNTVCMIWILYCRDGYKSESGCRSAMYRQEISLLALANFFKILSWPMVTYRSMKDAGQLHPCEESRNTSACVMIFHCPASKIIVEEVVQSIQYDIHGYAGLIVVDIDVGSDFCEKPSVDPQLTLQMPGGHNFHMDSTETWSLEGVENFLSSHLFPDSDSEPPESPEQGAEIDDADDKAQQLDDLLMAVVWEWRKGASPKCPGVPALTDKTFPTTVLDNRLVVVLFYLLYDPQSSLFLETYQNLSLKLEAQKGDNQLAHPLVRVDCYDWTDVCQKENITAYPSIRFYRNGGKIVQQYRQAFDEGVLLRAVRLLQAEQPVMLTTAENVASFASGNLPEKIHEDVDNFVLLKSESETDMTAFKEVAKKLETQMLFAIVDPSVQSEILPTHGVLHIRLKDVYEPSEQLTGNLDEDLIYNFLVKNQFHLLPELTHLNFPALYARKQPFAVLFLHTNTESSVAEVLVKIIKSNKFDNLIFCKMTLTGEDSVPERILTAYAGKVHVPSFAIVDHQKGEVFLKEVTDFAETELVSWITSVNTGAAPPTGRLEKGEWKPVRQPYNFLSKIDEAEKRRKKEKDPYCRFGNCERYEAFMDDEDHSMEAQLQLELVNEEQETRAQLMGLLESRLYSGKNPLPLPTNTQRADPSQVSSAKTEPDAPKPEMVDMVDDKMSKIELQESGTKAEDKAPQESSGSYHAEL